LLGGGLHELMRRLKPLLEGGGGSSPPYPSLPLATGLKGSLTKFHDTSQIVS